MLIEQLGDNQLFRWFIGYAPVEPFWPVNTFIRTRGRLLNEELMAKSLSAEANAVEATVQAEGSGQHPNQGSPPGLWGLS